MPCVYIHTYILFTHMYMYTGRLECTTSSLGGLWKQAQLKINRDILRTGRYSRQRDRELVSYAGRYNLKQLEEEVWRSDGTGPIVTFPTLLTSSWPEQGKEPCRRTGFMAQKIEQLSWLLHRASHIHWPWHSKQNEVIFPSSASLCPQPPLKLVEEED